MSSVRRCWTRGETHLIYTRIDPTSRDGGLFIRMQRDLLEAVGDASFGDQVARLVSHCASVAEFAGFALARGGDGPRSVLHFPDSADARARAEAYRTRFYRLDPIQRLTEDKTLPGFYVARVHAREIQDRTYRHICYEQPGYTEKLTLARRTPDMLTILSLFSRDRAGFTSEQVERLGHYGQIALPALSLHFRTQDVAQASSPLSLHEIEARLRATFPALTAREVAVCALSLTGVTAVGIGLELGIKPTSVLTYRRRAYDRLNISSVHQLSAALLR
jgi:DNA-binding CsgD family transcriptional regulator